MITVVVALPSEARALVAHWRLPRLCEKPFSVYANEDTRVVVSGIGGDLCAAAIGFAAGLRIPQPNDAWLNLGIAGHAHLAIGSVVLGGRVRRLNSDVSWFPSFLSNSSVLVVDVVSVAKPTSTYPANACVDMEAAAFMAAASRVGAGDLLQVLKIISDNQASGLGQITRESVADLVTAQIAVIEATLSDLRARADACSPALSAAVLTALLERWHFTHSQTLQLQRCAERFSALAPDAAWPPESIAGCRSASAVLTRLDDELTRLARQFAP